MAAFKVGDAVRVVTRDVTKEDEESGLYYAYFGGLAGTVDKVYDDGSVCVDVDLESLTEDMRKRHLEMQEDERKRWLNGLSGEVRNRLTADQRQLTISYRILVSKKDLEKDKGGKPKSGKANAASDSSEAQGDSGGSAGSANVSARGPDIDEQSPPENTAAPPDADEQLPGIQEPDAAEEPDAAADPQSSEGPGPKRRTQAEIEAAEEEYLKSLQNK